MYSVKTRHFYDLTAVVNINQVSYGEKRDSDLQPLQLLYRKYRYLFMFLLLLFTALVLQHVAFTLSKSL